MNYLSAYFSKSLSMVVALLLVASLTACGGKKAKDVEQIGNANFPTDSMMSGDDWSSSNEQAGMEEGTDQAVADDGAVPGTVAERLGGENMAAGSPVPELPPVYFEYDNDSLDQSANAVLAKSAEYLRVNPALQVVLRGHTDERGTEEYNVSLGSRRAQSVRDYLVFNGIEADRVQTISFGESMPASDGEDDTTRARNRRVEFFVYTLEE